MLVPGRFSRSPFWKFAGKFSSSHASKFIILPSSRAIMHEQSRGLIGCSGDTSTACDAHVAVSFTCVHNCTVLTMYCTVDTAATCIVQLSW